MTLTAGSGHRLAPSERERHVLELGVLLLLVVSVVSWRRGAFYTGGADPTVLAKAALVGLALVGSIVLHVTAPSRRALSAGPAWLVAAVVGVSLVGALLAGGAGASLVLAVRVGLLAVALVLLLRVTSSERVLGSLLTSMAAVGVFAAGTGALLGAGGRGRLAGGIPPLAPNELATLLLPPAIGAVALALRSRHRFRWIALAVVLAGLVVWTGSRTALAVLVVTAAVMVLCARVIPRKLLLVGLVAVLLLVAALLVSGVLTELLFRGEGVARFLTLNSRTISWSAVLSTPMDTWRWWVGGGLSIKQIAVTGQYWNTQVFDSSWISAMAQSGVIGTACLAVYAFGTVVTAGRPSGIRFVALPLMGSVLVRSFVENGLIDANVTFLLVMTIALATWPGSYALLRPSSSATTIHRVDRRPAKV